MDMIKHPYVLDFLEIPEAHRLHESELEAALLEKLQPFLLELGKGFAFVARQQRISTESQHLMGRNERHPDKPQDGNRQLCDQCASLSNFLSRKVLIVESRDNDNGMRNEGTPVKERLI